jgi:acid phosphatase
MEITMGVFALLLPTGRSNLMFATVGDWGAAMVSRKWDSSSEFAQREIEDRNTMLDVATAFAAQASGADFILALGDNFYENGVNSTTDPQWEKTWRANWVDPFPQMAGVPWYPVLGNHDYHQGVQAAKTQVLRTTATDDDEWQFPR